MAISDFKYFASDAGANVEDQLTWTGDLITSIGFETGEALSAKCNKAWRQSSMGSAVIAEYIKDVLTIDCLDNGVLPQLLTNFASAVNIAGWAKDTSSIVNVMSAELPIGPIGLIDGLVITLVPSITNTTSVTLNLNGLGAKPVLTNAGTLKGGELIAGSGFHLVYISTLGASGAWVLLNYQTTAVTQSVGESSNLIATTKYVMDSGFAPNNSPNLTGIPRSITPPVGDNSTKIATTAYVINAGFAPNDSPTLTGIPRSVTPPFGDNSTRIATTAFVQAALVPIIPPGTRMLFAQASAPTGWTMDVNDIANNRLLRVVNDGTGGQGGGSHNPILMNVVPAHTHAFTTGNASNDHTHYDTGHNHNTAATSWGGFFQWYPGNSGTGSQDKWITSTTGYAALTGMSANHYHMGSTDNGSSQTNWTPRYTNLIICTKN